MYNNNFLHNLYKYPSPSFISVFHAAGIHGEINPGHINKWTPLYLIRYFTLRPRKWYGPVRARAKCNSNSHIEYP